MGQTRYVLRENEHGLLNYEFFGLYNYRYWLYKICLLDFALDNPNEVFHPVGDNKFDSSDIGPFELSIKSEFFVVFNHTTESLFTLIYALQNYGLIWADMRELSTNELDRFISRNFVEGSMDDDKLTDVFYPLVQQLEDMGGEEGPDAHEMIDKSIDLIQEYLSRIGQMHVDGDVYREIYNHYKHGLRVSTNTVSILLENEEEQLQAWSEQGLPLDKGNELNEDAFVYFVREPSDYEGEDYCDYYKIVQKVKTLDYEMFKELSLINYELIEQIFVTMRAILDAEPRMRSDIGPGVTVDVKARAFYEEDIEELLGSAERFDAEIGRGYLSEAVEEIYIPNT